MLRKYPSHYFLTHHCIAYSSFIASPLAMFKIDYKNEPGAYKASALLTQLYNRSVPHCTCADVIKVVEAMHCPDDFPMYSLCHVTGETPTTMIGVVKGFTEYPNSTLAGLDGTVPALVVDCDLICKDSQGEGA